MKTKFKISNRILSLVLAFVMVLGMMPMTDFTAVAATTPTAYDGVPVTPTKITSSNYLHFGLTDSNWSTYNGYYGIRNAKELYGFAALVNGGSNSSKAVLLQDIVINSGTVTQDGSSAGTTYSWTPIGTTSNPFLGTFDGNGCTISGLYINGSSSYVGLFGVAGRYTTSIDNIQIKNLVLSNSYIHGYEYVGGVVGLLKGNFVYISNCRIASDVTVAATNKSLGGIVGGYTSAVMTSYVHSIKNCVVYGKVVSEYVCPMASGSVVSIDNVGAITGQYQSGQNAKEYIEVENCYFVKGCIVAQYRVAINDGYSDPITYYPDIGKGGSSYTYNTSAGCTILSSASDSHTCVSVTHREVSATCQYPGLSEYSYCLICGTVTSGTKTVTDVVDHKFNTATCLEESICAFCGKKNADKNPNNHASAETYYEVNSTDKTKHNLKNTCCNNVIATETHQFNTEGICTECAYVCEHRKTENGICIYCGLTGVPYLYRYYSGDEGKVISSNAIANPVTAITSSTTSMSNGWYVLEEDVTISSRIKISGTVNIILTDGCTLTSTKGITTTGATLNIYGQTEGTGTLNVTGAADDNAGIGGTEERNGGTVTINGGIVIAQGGAGGAGIGDGYKASGGTTVVINGGKVTATGGRNAAGIGGGYGNATASRVTINGGTIKATGTVNPNSAKYGGAGIGGGISRYNAQSSSGMGATVVINGGNIKATGAGGAGAFGRGSDSTASNGTLKNASGSNVSLKTITLSGASDNALVTEMQGMDSYGITDVRTLDTNKLYFYMSSDVTATSFVADDTEYTHKNGLVYTQHLYTSASCTVPATCQYCGHTEGEALGHSYVDGVCTVCGIGEADGIYYISTPEQLLAFATAVNAGDKDADAVLMADIDLADYSWTTICETDLYYKAYGTDLGYSGTFDGNGNVIKNITVTSSTTRDASCGLFGTVSGTIKHLGIEGFTFVDGGKDIRTGGIVGQLITANGKVSNCYVKNATINPGAHVTGGIAGCVYDGTIENCYVVESTISGSSGRYGYIVGDSRGDNSATDRPGTVTNCYTDNATIRSNNVGNVTNCATKTTEAFASGEVTYLLNGSKSDGELVWYQTLGTDAYPQFTGSVVYYDSVNGYNNHIHNWTYTKDGNKITATCDATGCTTPNGGYVTIAVPSDLTYTGSNIEADVENALTTGATVNVEYSGNTTDGYPVNVGEYTAKITIDGKEISVDYTIVAASIEGANVTASDAVYTGNAQKPAVTVKLGDKTLTEGTDYTVEYSNNTAVGTATVTVTGKGNYTKTGTGSFDIAYLTGAPDAAVSGTQGAAGWYTSDVTLTAPDGYTISKTVDGAYGDSLTFADEQNKTVTYYLKNLASGEVAQKTVELKIDLNPPTAKYEINDDGWRSFIKFISFGIFCKDNADLSITASDTMDESVTVQYVVSTTKLTASEITDWKDYSDKVALNPKAKNYIYIKVTDDAGHTVVSESGVVVFADSTASAEIEYTKHSTEDVTAQIVFNGNTVKEVKYGSTVLTTDQYTVTDSGIQFKADYLNTFAASDTPYTFTVTYNPMGESWVESADGIANAAVGTTTINLTVKKATLTITGATLADKTYNGSASGTVTGVTFKETDKLVLGTDYTATVVYDDANAGSRTATVTVTLLNTDKANAYALESTTYTMDATIGKAKAPTLTDVKANYKFTITGFEAEVASVGMPADAGDIAYTEGTASVSGNATVTAWNVDENGKVTATISGGAKEDVITLPVTVSSDNYEDAVVNVVVTLGNRPAQSALTVKADSSVIYGNELTLSTEGGSGTGEVTYSIVSGSENATIEGNVLTATKVGTVVITATKAGDDDYEPATSAQFTIEVTQRELEITGAAATDRVYNGKADVTITNIALGNIYTNDDVSVTFNTTGTVSSENKGKYSEVTVSGLSLKGEDAANYKLPESADGKYTVSTEVEISALDISGAEITLGNALTYNGSEQTQTITGVTKNGLTVTYTVSDNKNTNHGNYELTVIGTGNFTGTQTKAWSIAKRKITVTATAQTITYGKSIAADAFTSTNVVNGHKLDVTLTPSTANVTVSGTITVTVNDITADGTSVIGNYDVSVSSGKLTIQPDLSAISDLTTENVTSADKADIEAVKDMMSKADYANADEETKAAWDAIVANCDTLLAKIEAVADEINRVTDKTGSYNAGTVNSDDAADLNKLAADIKALTDSKNLTDEERTELTALAETVAALQKVVTDTTAENKRIAEELAKFDKDTVNSDSTDELAQLLSDIEKQLDSTNLTEAEKKALEDAKTAVTDMQKVIADTAAENDRISDEVDKYSIDTVKSSDEEALNTLLDEIEDQLTSTHLTDEEISELNGDKTAVEDLLAKIKGTDELIDKLTGDVGGYKDETVKSTDRDALEQIIEDAQALIDSGNVTDSEKEALKGVQKDAQALIDVIDDTAEDVKAITDKAASYNDETVKSTDKDELEQIIEDIDTLLDGDNLTDTERESLEEIKQTVQDLIDTIDDTADAIKAASETISGLDEETVKSTDKETIEQVIENIDELLDGDNLTEDERKTVEDTKAKAEDLLDAIDDAAKAPVTENTEKVKDVTTENVTPDDKTDLENAKADLEKALEDHGDNYTDEEKKAIEDEIKRIDEALEVIGKVEAVEEQINNLPENITRDDTDDVDAAKKAYDELSDYEKTLVDPETKKKLEEAIKAAEEANKPADTTSPGTGDNSNIPGLFALMLGSLAAMFAIIFGTKKKKKAEDR